MVLTHTPDCDTGRSAYPFRLLGTDGQYYEVDQLKGPNGLLVIFMCNHCPYVKAILPRLNDEAVHLQNLGIGVVGINSNDALAYPDDSYEKMVELAKQKHLNFPYLHDDTQSVAQEYGAVCTPDFFGYNADLSLQYRGCFHPGGLTEPSPNDTIPLFEAMKEVAENGSTELTQTPSMGCSIKWRADG